MEIKESTTETLFQPETDFLPLAEEYFDTINEKLEAKRIDEQAITHETDPQIKQELQQAFINDVDTTLDKLDPILDYLETQINDPRSSQYHTEILEYYEIIEQIRNQYAAEIEGKTGDRLTDAIREGQPEESLREGKGDAGPAGPRYNAEQDAKDSIDTLSKTYPKILNLDIVFLDPYFENGLWVSDGFTHNGKKSFKLMIPEYPQGNPVGSEPTHLTETEKKEGKLYLYKLVYEDGPTKYFDLGPDRDANQATTLPAVANDLLLELSE